MTHADQAKGGNPVNIFYFSEHEILEVDEVRLFHSLGHDVFSLGINSACGTPGPFRHQVALTPVEMTLHNLYRQSGGHYRGRKRDEILPPGFLGHVQAYVIMHDVGFLEDMWPRIKNRLVIWRSIGQFVDSYEDRLRPMRAEGLRIVRYSEVERDVPNSVGQDAIIRFGKDSSRLSGWTGERACILTFANSYQARYPENAADWIRIVEGLPAALGGEHNEAIPQSIGLLPEDAQLEAYRASRVYLYASGLHIPYTLNFMEAWMTGIPVVVYAPLDRLGRWFETDKLIDHGRDGYVCRTIEETRKTLQALLDDYDLARRIGQAGRASAIALFDDGRAAAQWDKILQPLARSEADSKHSPSFFRHARLFGSRR